MSVLYDRHNNEAGPKYRIIDDQFLTFERHGQCFKIDLDALFCDNEDEGEPQ